MERNGSNLGEVLKTSRYLMSRRALMTKPRVFVSRNLPMGWLEKLQNAADLEVWGESTPASRAVLLEKVRGIDGLLSFITERVDGELMDAAGPSLKVIAQFGVGYDNIDVSAATLRRVAVGNTPGVLTETTADFAWALLMAAARRVVESADYVKSGSWKISAEPTLLLGYDIFGATLGIIGFGRIGQAVARRARGFNMHILYYDVTSSPSAEQEFGATRVSLETLLQESDFVSIHTNLNQETYHLITTAQLALMKESAILVNAARGPIVDEQALFQALEARQIACAALDVMEKEPLPGDSPLLKLDNIIIAPHIASASYQTRQKMAMLAADNILSGLEGKRLAFCVNPEVYEK
jgi:glyoxylate reductase